MEHGKPVLLSSLHDESNTRFDKDCRLSWKRESSENSLGSWNFACQLISCKAIPSTDLHLKNAGERHLVERVEGGLSKDQDR